MWIEIMIVLFLLPVIGVLVLVVIDIVSVYRARRRWTKRGLDA